MYSDLLRRFPERTDLWNGFLIAAARCPARNDAPKVQLLTIYAENRERFENTAFLTNLLNAVARHGDPRQSLTLMQHLVKSDPGDVELRLRLGPTGCTRRSNSRPPTCIIAGCSRMPRRRTYRARRHPTWVAR